MPRARVDNNPLHAAVAREALNLKVLYRKMSDAEYSQINALKVADPAFGHNKSNNYVLWFSTSLIKTRHFTNENAYNETNVILKVELNDSILGNFSAGAKVGNDKRAAVLIHREKMMIGEMNQNDVDQLLQTKDLHFNIGFRESKKSAFHALIKKISTVSLT